MRCVIVLCALPILAFCFLDVAELENDAFRIGVKNTALTKIFKKQHFLWDIVQYLEGITDNVEEESPAAPVQYIRSRKGHRYECSIGKVAEEYKTPSTATAFAQLDFDDCIVRNISGWIYEVCGHLAVSRRSANSRKHPWSTRVLLGALGGSRRLSTHRPSVKEPAYVEEIFTHGDRCEMRGDWRFHEAIVRYVCEPRFPSGLAHIYEVVKNHECSTTIRVQTGALCKLAFFNRQTDNVYPIRCKRRVNTARITYILKFVTKRMFYKLEVVSLLREFMEIRAWLDEPYVNVDDVFTLDVDELTGRISEELEDFPDLPWAVERALEDRKETREYLSEEIEEAFEDEEKEEKNKEEDTVDIAKYITMYLAELKVSIHEKKLLRRLKLAMGNTELDLMEEDAKAELLEEKSGDDNVAEMLVDMIHATAIENARKQLYAEKDEEDVYVESIVEDE